MELILDQIRAVRVLMNGSLDGQAVRMSRTGVERVTHDSKGRFKLLSWMTFCEQDSTKTRKSGRRIS